jgi:putative membrane protein
VKRFLAGEGSKALLEAVRAVESRSSAEVVVTVRPWAGSQAGADLGWALGAGAVTLALVVFGPWPISTPALFLDPAFAALLAFLCSRAFPALRRLVTPRRLRDERVREAAAALFHEKGVHQTRDRTGLLVHVSLLERAVVVLPDLGVAEAVEEPAWEAAVERLRAVVGGGGDAAALAAQLAALGEVLEPALPRSADDVNELADEPCA